MQAVESFLEMGGYAAFVWPAYALTALVMTGITVQTLRRYRRAQRELAELQRGRPVGARRRVP